MTCKLKEGLDISQLTSAAGADFELVGQEDTYIEDEEEVEEKLLYQRKVVEHLNPECADMGDEGISSDSDSGTTLVSLRERSCLFVRMWHWTMHFCGIVYCSSRTPSV